MSDYTMGIVAAVSNDKILTENLLKSPLISKEQASLLTVKGAKSAGEAYNKRLTRFKDRDLIVYVHQDVYLPKTWHQNVANAINKLNSFDKNWAVLGVFGKTAQGKAIGRVWDCGMGIEIGEKFSTPARVDAIDELLIIINPKADLGFDEQLPGFHLFGADICASARSLGYQCYAIHAPVIHNSQTIQTLGGDYARAYRYLQKKWRDVLPLNAICSKITRWGIEYQRIRFGLSYRRFFGLLGKRPAGSDKPVVVVKQLGYE